VPTIYALLPMTPTTMYDFDYSLLKPETFACSVETLEPADQLGFWEDVVVRCQNLQNQTAGLLITTLDWMEEKNLS
jgi:hypothetical protein